MNDLVEYKDHSVIVMDNIPPFCEEEYDLFDKTDFKKYVQDGENLIRKSFEYRRFISYLRNYMDMNKCSFFENISNRPISLIILSNCTKIRRKYRKSSGVREKLCPRNKKRLCVCIGTHSLGIWMVLTS